MGFVSQAHPSGCRKDTNLLKIFPGQRQTHCHKQINSYLRQKPPSFKLVYGMGGDTSLSYTGHIPLIPYYKGLSHQSSNKLQPE